MSRAHLLLVAALLAAPGPAVATPAATSDPAADATDARRWLEVQVGQSVIWQGERQIARLLLSDPDVAEVKLIEEGQFQVRGLEVGTTDLWVWYRDQKTPVSYQLSVHQDLSDLLRRMGEVTGDAEPPRVYPMNGRLVLEGPVSDVETLERLAAMARLYDPEFVNLMSVVGDHQVQLHVVFAEVSRTGLRELGLNPMAIGADWQVGWYGPNYGDAVGMVDPDTGETLSWFFPTTGAFQLLGVAALDDVLLAGFLGALEKHTLSKIMAEPTLVALSGQEAQFLAGGEFPIAITTFDQVKIEFKEYGIKLGFVPTVLGGDVIDLRVSTEVSELDTTVAINVGGLAVPGLLTRKGSSHLRLRDGTTFAMAGLLSETVRSTRSEVPFLGRIPLVGTLFRYTDHEVEETELMIFVTPRLVRPMEPGEVPAPPTASEDNNPTDVELFFLGMDHRTGSRAFEAAGPVGMER